MSVIIKSADDIEKMRVAGQLAAQVLVMIEPYVKEGVTTDELNTYCHEYITKEQNAIPAPLNYKGYPKSICTSVNNVVCHGIPGDKKLKNGDILNIDITVIKDGFHGDTSKMFIVGTPTRLAQRLIDVTQKALYQAIKIVKPGAKLGDIGHTIESYAQDNHFTVVRDYCGHGIGKVFHEDPQVLHFGKKNTGMPLEKGMTFTIEPMINAGKSKTKTLRDGWTVVTRDRSLSAQFEHTLAVTDTGVEVLTLREEEKEKFHAQ